MTGCNTPTVWLVPLHPPRGILGIRINSEWITTSLITILKIAIFSWETHFPLPPLRINPCESPSSLHLPGPTTPGDLPGPRNRQRSHGRHGTFAAWPANHWANWGQVWSTPGGCAMEGSIKTLCNPHGPGLRSALATRFFSIRHKTRFCSVHLPQNMPQQDILNCFDSQDKGI